MFIITSYSLVLRQDSLKIVVSMGNRVEPCYNKNIDISYLSFSDRRLLPQKCEGVKHQF